MSEENTDSVNTKKLYNNLISIAKKEANALANILFLRNSLKEDLIPKTYRSTNKKHLKVDIRKIDAAKATSIIWMKIDIEEEEARFNKLKEEIEDKIKSAPEPVQFRIKKRQDFLNYSQNMSKIGELLDAAQAT